MGFLKCIFREVRMDIFINFGIFVLFGVWCCFFYLIGNFIKLLIYVYILMFRKKFIVLNFDEIVLLFNDLRKVVFIF